MNVIVNKRSLVHAIVESLAEVEAEEPEFERISMDDNEPIKPVEMMSTQLVQAMPPVDDPEFTPESLIELARAAYVIAKEVPSSQIVYYYKKLHELLDSALDRESEREMKIENFKRSVGKLIEEDDPESHEDDDLPQLTDDDESRLLDPSDATPESLAREVVDLIIKKSLHTVPLSDPDSGEVHMVPVVTINPKTGDFQLSEKEMRVLASENYGHKIIEKSLELSDVRQVFDNLASLVGGKEAAYIWVYSNLVPVLGKEGSPVTSELAAEMYANQIADAIGKHGEAVTAQLNQMADEVQNQTEDIAAQIGRGSDALSIVTPPDEFAAALRTVAAQRLEPPRRGRPRLYDDDEPREAMTSEMRKKIRAERRAAELELEYEPGKLHLSPKALRAMMDTIATNLNTSLGNVRNVIYDDLKVMGLPAADLRKMAQIDIPGGREKIPFTYDPLRIQAQEELVEKMYEMYRGALQSYIDEVASSDNEEERDIGTAYRDLFFGPGGYYQPGLDGYLQLQSSVGGPTVDDPDSVDIDSSEFRTRRKAYDFIQEFIDQIAKEWLDPESDEYRKAKEGGIRAFLNSMVSEEIFSDLNSRSDIDEILDKELAALENGFDEDTLKSIIDIVFDKAPRRTKKYISRVKKEMG